MLNVGLSLGLLFFETLKFVYAWIIIGICIYTYRPKNYQQWSYLFINSKTLIFAICKLNILLLLFFKFTYNKLIKITYFHIKITLPNFFLWISVPTLCNVNQVKIFCLIFFKCLCFIILICLTRVFFLLSLLWYVGLTS